MKKVLFMAVVAASMLAASCGNKTADNADGKDSAAVDSTEAVKAEAPEEKPDTIKGPATVDMRGGTVEVPEGWYVKRASTSMCGLEPLVRPNVEGKGNFGWSISISIWLGKSFSAQKYIDDDKKLFKDTKKMSPLTINGLKYAYNFYDYEYGKHSVLAAQLPDEKGVVNIDVGGYAVEDPEIQQILKSIKLKQ